MESCGLTQHPARGHHEIDRFGFDSSTSHHRGPEFFPMSRQGRSLHLEGPGSRIAAVIAILWLSLTTGSAVAHAATFPTEAEHAKYCKCRNCRKESCCCGPRRPGFSFADPKRSSGPASIVEGQAKATPASLAVPPPTVDLAVPLAWNGPCMGASPCGDPGLPTSSSPIVTPEWADDVASEHRRPYSAVRLRPPVDSPAYKSPSIDQPTDPPDLLLG